jgi:hypothetical protein
MLIHVERYDYDWLLGSVSPSDMLLSGLLPNPGLLGRDDYAFKLPSEIGVKDE